MSPTTQQLRNRLEQHKGRRDALESELAEERMQRDAAERRVEVEGKALDIVRAVALETQKEMEYHLSDCVSLALESVFPYPYRFGVEFVQRRNRTECDLYLERHGERIDPLTEAGGGVVDVTAFALRAALWSMSRPRPTPILILDEPFRNLSENLHEAASGLLKRVAEDTGLQLIVVSYSSALAEEADRVYSLHQGPDGRTKLEVS